MRQRAVPLALSMIALSACASDVYPADASRRDVVDVACPPDRPIRCNGECVGDTDSNPLHCGATCAMCSVPDHGSAVCASGVCGIRCSPGYVAMDGLPPPHPTRPLTNARVSVTQPTLHWSNPPSTHAAHVTVCRDRACTSVVTEFDAEGTSARVPSPLGAGVWFWNLRAIDAGVISAARSATWSFHTPAESGPVEWSWAERPDFNGDGIDDLSAVDCTIAGGAPIYSTSLFPGGHEIGTGILVPGLIRVTPIGDVDGDGFTDLASIGSTTSTLFAGGADLTTLRTLQTVSIPGDTPGIDLRVFNRALGDFDGDGFGDALVFDTRPMIARGSSMGWRTFDTLPESAPHGLFVGYDSNADGFDDLVEGGPTIWPGNASGVMNPQSIGGVAIAALIPIGDFDGDGYLDAEQVGVQGDQPIALVRGTASGAVMSPSQPLDVHDQRWLIGDVGDLDGDGIGDLLFISTLGDLSGHVLAYRGSSSGYSQSNFFEPSLPCAVGSLSWALSRRIGDVDANGHEDYALVCLERREVFLHMDGLTPGARWVRLPGSPCWIE